MFFPLALLPPPCPARESTSAASSPNRVDEVAGHIAGTETARGSRSIRRIEICFPASRYSSCLHRGKVKSQPSFRIIERSVESLPQHQCIRHSDEIPVNQSARSSYNDLSRLILTESEYISTRYKVFYDGEYHARETFCGLKRFPSCPTAS